jgi:hypothetical protein
MTDPTLSSAAATGTAAGTSPHDAISSERVLGTTVYGPDGDKLGSIDGLMINKLNGRVRYAVLEFGGFLGLGTDRYPLPWSMLKYDTRLEGYVVPLTKEKLDGAAAAVPERRAGRELGWTPPRCGRGRRALFAGNLVPEGAEPIAQAYAGHQFGGFSPQLGDGRALLLGEVIDRHGRRRDIAFKGSGRTPFSRGGDGKAAVGPMLREVLIGEAMHALGIPTTRALAVAATGEPVLRDRPLPGAVLTRVAASHLRVGTFQFFAARGELERLRQLPTTPSPATTPTWLRCDAPDRPPGAAARVAQRQAALIAQWMNVGFIHGVMNTDNMTISGETIDYGPCAFMEAYDPATVFSSSTTAAAMPTPTSRIARWNLARLAETLLPLMADEPTTSRGAARGGAGHRGDRRLPGAGTSQALREGQRAKLGLQQAAPPTTRPTPRWPTTGWRCCRRSRWTSRWPGAGWPMPPRRAGRGWRRPLGPGGGLRIRCHEALQFVGRDGTQRHQQRGLAVGIRRHGQPGRVAEHRCQVGRDEGRPALAVLVLRLQGRHRRRLPAIGAGQAAQPVRRQVGQVTPLQGLNGGRARGRVHRLLQREPQLHAVAARHRDRRRRPAQVGLHALPQPRQRGGVGRGLQLQHQHAQAAVAAGQAGGGAGVGGGVGGQVQAAEFLGQAGHRAAARQRIGAAVCGAPACHAGSSGAGPPRLA